MGWLPATPGWFECRCGQEFFSPSEPLGHVGEWQPCWRCRLSFGRWLMYLAQTGHVSPWWRVCLRVWFLRKPY